MPLSPAIASSLGGGLAALVYAADKLITYYAGRRTPSLDERFATLDRNADQRITELRTDIAEVRAFVVGPDGENGIRGDLREVKKRVIALEERELRRLEAHDVGAFHPPR